MLRTADSPGTFKVMPKPYWCWAEEVIGWTPPLFGWVYPITLTPNGINKAVTGLPEGVHAWWFSSDNMWRISHDQFQLHSCNHSLKKTFQNFEAGIQDIEKQILELRVK